ncbi:hypothetical protein R1sor_004598 [Riccia sorocarpa]|uniref:Uncharacterized protein n=1 Tax=Riccia sorocarpa TaxID=122646 RepID=A0ABD3HHE2_9MARC
MLGLSLAAHVLLAALEEMDSGLHQLVVVSEKVAVANAEPRHQYVDIVNRVENRMWMHQLLSDTLCQTKAVAVVLAVSGDDQFVVVAPEFDPELGWRGRYHHEAVTVVAPDEEAYVLAGPLHAKQSAAAESEGSMFVASPQWMAAEAD